MEEKEAKKGDCGNEPRVGVKGDVKPGRGLGRRCRGCPMRCRE